MPLWIKSIFFEKNLQHFYKPIIYNFIALFFNLWAIWATIPSHNIEQRYLHIKKVTKSLILAPDHKSFLPKVITDTRTMEDSNLWYAIQILCAAICPLLWLWSTFYSIHTPAIDLVLIAYLDSMTMTSFNIFKARVVMFKKLKVNAKMQIEQAVVLVGGGSFGLAD